MAESLVGQALSAMRPVSVNFSDVNQLAAQQSQAISNIGNIFDKMDQRKLEEQKLEQNLMLERAKLLEQSRQFGITKDQDWREALLTDARVREQNETTRKHYEALEKQAALTHQFEREKYDYAKQRELDYAKNLAEAYKYAHGDYHEQLGREEDAVKANLPGTEEYNKRMTDIDEQIKNKQNWIAQTDTALANLPNSNKNFYNNPNYTKDQIKDRLEIEELQSKEGEAYLSSYLASKIKDYENKYKTSYELKDEQAQKEWDQVKATYRLDEMYNDELTRGLLGSSLIHRVSKEDYDKIMNKKMLETIQKDINEYNKKYNTTYIPPGKDRDEKIAYNEESKKQLENMRKSYIDEITQLQKDKEAHTKIRQSQIDNALEDSGLAERRRQLGPNPGTDDMSQYMAVTKFMAERGFVPKNDDNIYRDILKSNLTMMENRLKQLNQQELEQKNILFKHNLDMKAKENDTFSQMISIAAGKEMDRDDGTMIDNFGNSLHRILKNSGVKISKKQLAQEMNNAFMVNGYDWWQFGGLIGSKKRTRPAHTASGVGPRGITYDEITRSIQLLNSLEKLNLSTIKKLGLPEPLENLLLSHIEK